MKKLLLLLLLPLFVQAQTNLPKPDSTKLTSPPIVGSFTPSNWYYRGGNASNGDVGFLNTVTGKWMTFVTGYQFWKYAVKYTDTANMLGNYVRLHSNNYITGALNQFNGSVSIKSSVLRIYDTLSNSETIYSADGAVTRNNITHLPTTYQMMPASGNFRINELRTDSIGVYWDATNNEWRIGYRPNVYDPNLGGDCTLCTITQGVHNKIRQSEYGGSWNYLAWNIAEGTMASPTPVSNGHIFGSIVSVGYTGRPGAYSWAHAAEYRQISTADWFGVGYGGGHHWRTVIPGDTLQTDAMGLGMSSTGIDLELYQGAFIGKGETLTGGYTNTFNLSEATTSTTSFHAGQFNDNSYLSNNWYYHATHLYDDNTKGSSSLLLTNGSIVFSTSVANTVPIAALTIDNTQKATFAGKVNIATISVYANNAAALAGGLIAGDIYKTSTGVLMIAF